MPHFQSLPPDVLREVALHAHSGSDILNLILTSKLIYPHLCDFLYHDIHVRGLQSSLKVIQFLLAHPHIARTVVSIVLRPNYLLGATKTRLDGEQDLARAVERLAPYLYQLQRFIWDGIEAAPNEMWASLRAGCLQLKHIGTNIGNRKLDPDSEIFAFSDLRSFTLTTELHYQNLYYELSRQRGEHLPQRLWTMLIDRCPNLEFLIIGDEGPTMHSERTLSIKPLLQARWPNLRSLFLSNVRFSNPFDNESHLDDQRLALFITGHLQNLRRLKYHPHPNVGIYTESYDPRQISPLRLLSSSCGIPSEHFTSQLGLLRQVHLTDKSYRGEQEWSAVKRYLGSLSALEHLSIQLDFSAEIQDGSYKFDKNRKIVYKPVRHDQIGELQALYESCPRGLKSLKLVICTSAEETIYWRDIPTIFHRRQNVRSANSGKGLGRYLSLKHLEVWKVLKKSSSEDNLGMAAARIALDENPGLVESDLSPSPRRVIFL
ncbi:hypothetical protein D9757_013508 [Collybiopsis confluens]|uniref:Uncharacterized protein n=1 Tax=Collybiopsis confluens TaxID=2823264 RepID=A0A8H5FQK8_9AGAR|nr:hypothetical protein D9757_013508 [Collybiopsis confluens]